MEKGAGSCAEKLSAGRDDSEKGPGYRACYEHAESLKTSLPKLEMQRSIREPHEAVYSISDLSKNLLCHFDMRLVDQPIRYGNHDKKFLG